MKDNKKNYTDQHLQNQKATTGTQLLQIAGATLYD